MLAEFCTIMVPVYCLPEKRGGLPLHFAVINGHLSTVRLLLELLSPGDGDIYSEFDQDSTWTIRKSPELELIETRLSS